MSRSDRDTRSAIASRGPGYVRVTVEVDAPPQAVFDAATDWAAQGEWVAGTTVRVVDGDGASVGSRIEAITGVRRGGRGAAVRRVGLVDIMEVTGWDPPRSLEVLHVGRVVRGPGEFAFEPLPDGRTRFVWLEWLHLPLGRLGRLGWPVVRPLFAVGLRASLRSFAAYAARRHGGSGAARRAADG